MRLDADQHAGASTRVFVGMCGDWGESSARNDPHSFFHLLSHSFIHFSFALPSAWSSLLLDSHIYPSHRVSGFCSGNSAQRCFEPACLWPPEHSTHPGEGRMDRPPGYGDLLTCFPGPRGESALSALLRSESGGGMFTTFHQHPRPCSPLSTAAHITSCMGHTFTCFGLSLTAG